MPVRPIRLLLLALVALVLLAVPASAHEGEHDTTTGRRPATTVEAAERDDGSTNAAPWIIGSGLAALAAVGIGGTVLKSRQV